MLERLVALERARMELRRRIAINLAYPILLLGALLALFTLFAVWIVPQFRQIFVGFGSRTAGDHSVRPGRIALRDLDRLGSLARRAGAGAAAAAGRAGAGRSALASGAFDRPHGALVEDEPIRLADGDPARSGSPGAGGRCAVCAGGLREPDLASGCRKVAVAVESGHPLAESLSRHRQFPPTLAPFVAWGQAHANMPEAFRAAGEAFDGCAEGDMVLLETVLLPFTLVVILSGAFFLIIGLFLPLISLIQNLT